MRPTSDFAHGLDATVRPACLGANSLLGEPLVLGFAGTGAKRQPCLWQVVYCLLAGLVRSSRNPAPKVIAPFSHLLL